MYIDEAHYMRRAVQVLEGMGPQESKSVYVYPYDHPYFGQLFLAGALKLVGYPNSVLLLLNHPSSLNNPNSNSNPSNLSSSSSFTSSPTSTSNSTSPSSTSNSTSPSSTATNSSNIRNSIEMLYLVPRVLMGILSIIDTLDR